MTRQKLDDAIDNILGKQTKPARSAAEQMQYDEIRAQVLKDMIDERKPGIAEAVKEEAKVHKVDVYVRLPPHASKIQIDGRQYFHGMTYQVTPGQLDTMTEIMGRAWAHEEEVQGQRKPFDSFRLKVA
jgi:hypothetical protein